MADEFGPPLVSFAGGFFSGRVDSQLRESAQQSWFNLTSFDAGPSNTGATITGSQTTQLTGYQIQAQNTWFSTVAAGSAAVLPQTSRPFPLTGLMVFVINTGVNPLNLYPHPGDPGNSINGLAANAPVVLGSNTITPFQSIVPGIWYADSIGTGFAGSLETVVPQNPVGSTTHTQAGGTPITQALVFLTVNNASDAFTLMPAKPGLSIQVFNTSATNAPTIYPASQAQGGVTGGDQINTLGQNTVFSSITNTAGALPSVIFGCGVAGQWWTK